MHTRKLLLLAALSGGAAASGCDPFSEDQCAAHGGVHLVQRQVRRVGQDPAAPEAIATEEKPYSSEETWHRLNAMKSDERNEVLNLMLARAETGAKTPNYNSPRFSFAGLVEYFCGRFTKSRWASFMWWGLQVSKRMKYAESYPGGGAPPVARPNVPGGSNVSWFSSEKVKDWVNHASNMACANEYEVRKGVNPYRADALKYMQGIMELPDDAEWPAPPHSDGFYIMPWCSNWYKQNLCHIMAWAEYLGGEKAAKDAADGNICWDKIDYPVPAVLRDDLVMWPEQIMPGSEDFVKCMDTTLNDVALRGMCPMGHYAPPGYDEQVKECRTKLPSEYEPPLRMDQKPSPLGVMGTAMGLNTPVITMEDRFWYAVINATQGEKAVEEVSGMSAEDLKKAYEAASEADIQSA